MPRSSRAAPHARLARDPESPKSSDRTGKGLSVTDALHDLFTAALAAREHAYAPYSRFAVGAAVRTPEGRIFAGANVENAAYPVGTCAETAAVSAMISGGGRRIAAVLVLAATAAAIAPCGACRQRLREFMDGGSIVYSANLEGVTTRWSLDALLPHAFGPCHLGEGQG